MYVFHFFCSESLYRKQKINQISWLENTNFRPISSHNVLSILVLNMITKFYKKNKMKRLVGWWGQVGGGKLWLRSNCLIWYHLVNLDGALQRRAIIYDSKFKKWVDGKYCISKHISNSFFFPIDMLFFVSKFCSEVNLAHHPFHLVSLSAYVKSGNIFAVASFWTPAMQAWCHKEGVKMKSSNDNHEHSNGINCYKGFLIIELQVITILLNSW